MKITISHRAWTIICCFSLIGLLMAGCGRELSDEEAAASTTTTTTTTVTSTSTSSTTSTTVDSTPVIVPIAGGGSFSYQNIASTGTNGNIYSSIAVDKNNANRVHISYYQKDTEDLKYASGTISSWAFETVDSAGDRGLYSSIGIDSNQKIQISYYATSAGLAFAYGSGGSWTTATVDNPTGIDVGYYTSLGIDSGNKAHISYYDWDNQALKYATNKSGAWVVTTLDGSGNTGLYSSLAIDSGNNIHISYYDAGNKDLKYANYSAGAWH